MSSARAGAAQGDNLVRTHADARMEVFENAGHALFVDEPERFNALLIDFLDTTSAGADGHDRAPPRKTRAALMPLFLIALGVVGIENALTRYFAVAKWSEYGYWIISIVMAGFALSRRRRGPVPRHGGPARRAAADRPARPRWCWRRRVGYQLVTANPFNPLQLQNPTTWPDQVRNIGLYYAALLPFFFLAGLYISLIFVLNHREIGRVYGYDLIGAGLGAALALGADVRRPPLPAGAGAAGPAGARDPVPAGPAELARRGCWRARRWSAARRSCSSARRRPSPSSRPSTRR